MNMTSESLPTFSRAMTYCREHPRRLVLYLMGCFVALAIVAVIGLCWIRESRDLTGYPASLAPKAPIRAAKSQPK